MIRKQWRWRMLLVLLLCIAAPVLAQSKNEPPPAANVAPMPMVDLRNLLRPAANAGEAETPPEPGFGALLLEWLEVNGRSIVRGLKGHVADIAALPQIGKWLDQQSAMPQLAERWDMTTRLLGSILLTGLSGAFALHFVLTPWRRRSRARPAVHVARKLALGLAEFGFNLMPLLLFVAVALYLLSEFAPPLIVRMVILSIIYAIASAHLLLLTGKLILSPRNDHLRLLPCGPRRAQSLYRWLRALTIVIVYGYFFIDAARLVNVPPGARTAFANLLGLAVLAISVFLIRAHRTEAANWLRGGALPDSVNPVDWTRQRLAASWHWLMIAYLTIGYSVTSFGPGGGNFALLLRGTIITLAVILAMNVLLYGLSQLALRAARAGERQERLPLHQPILRGLLQAIVLAGSAGLILLGWEVDVAAWLKTGLGQWLSGAAVTISLAIIIAVLCYEAVCGLLDASLRRHAADNRSFSRLARMRTLQPLIKHSAAIVMSVVVILAGLSELGVNIAPLLAGAGIIGVAIGFGSQALVKDIITGLFIIIEDTIHVGDVIESGTHAGAVENMTIRTLRLRDINGALHVLPYSEVTGFINKTRDFAYAVIEVGVAYQTDVAQALKIMEQAGLELQQDTVLGPSIIAPPEVVAGILSFGDSAVGLRCRIKTMPGQHWNVKFAYMLRLKTAFEVAGIVIPYPTITHKLEGEQEKPSPQKLLERSLRGEQPKKPLSKEEEERES